MGCNVQPNWNFPSPPLTLENISSHLPSSFNYYAPGPHRGLTDEEKEVLNHLKEAWAKFVALENHIPHDLTEFNYAIHMAQQKLAMRVARRVDSDVWRQPEQQSE